MITDTEIDTFVSDTLNSLQAFRDSLLEDRARPYLGKTLKIMRRLKDPTSGEYHDVVLDAVISGARWGYEDGIDFKVIYTHPFTGKTVETEQGA